MKLIMTVEDPKTRRQAYKQHLGIGVLLQANNSHGGGQHGDHWLRF